ncbi:hypothetical protein ACFS3C_04055 [Azotobacter vinelandii]
MLRENSLTLANFVSSGTSRSFMTPARPHSPMPISETKTPNSTQYPPVLVSMALSVPSAASVNRSR